MSKRWLSTLISWLVLSLFGQGFAMQPDGCGAGECRDCHSLSKDEAKGLLKELPVEVLDVGFSEVPGLWVVDVEKRTGGRAPVFVDFSKQYLLSGRVLKLASKEDVTMKRMIDLNRIDPSVVPLGDALVIGNPEAEHKIVVFDDPECKFCEKIHAEMKKLATERKDVAFYIKMYPLNSKSREKAKAIVCSRSLQMLEDSLAKRAIPPADCETNQIDENLRVGREIGVRSTPTLVLPDGRVVPGFKTAEKIADLLEESRSNPP